MYLSQLILNPRSRAARRDLADVQELHRRIMSAFPQRSDDAKGPRESFGVLHRLEIDSRSNRIRLLVQSDARPAWSVLEDGYLASEAPDNPCCKEITGAYDALENGQVLAFRLRANPTRKIMTKTGPDGRKSNGKRVALTVERDPDTGAVVKDAEQARIEWLQRKGRDGGFELVAASGAPDVPDVRVIPEDRVHGGGRKTFWPVLYEGHLRITDADRFREELASGIGPAKAYGFGLLSVAPPRR